MLTRSKRKLIIEHKNEELLPKRPKTRHNKNFLIDSESNASDNNTHNQSCSESGSENSSNTSDSNSSSDSSNSGATHVADCYFGTDTIDQVRDTEDKLNALACPIAPLTRHVWGDAFSTLRTVLNEIEGLRVPAMPPKTWIQWTMGNSSVVVTKGRYGSKQKGAVCEACGLKRDLTLRFERQPLHVPSASALQKDLSMRVGVECGRRIHLAQRLWNWVIAASGGVDGDNGDKSEREYAQLMEELQTGGYAWETDNVWLD